MSSSVGAKATNKASRIDNSDALDHGVRVGLVAYGVVHLIVAWTALQLALGDQSGSASQTGAFSQMAETTAGQLSLYVVAAGFFALVVWQAFEAAVGHRRSDGAKRVFHRIGSAAKAVVYAVLGVSAFKMALGQGQGSSGTDTWTAKLMSAPGGQLLVGAVGLTIIGIGVYLVYKGLSEKFSKDLDAGAKSGDRRTTIMLLGKVGYAVKGVAFVAVGLLFVVAAVQHEADKSGGLDQALHQLLQQPFGGVLVGGIALGLACFGLYCFAWARHLDR